MPDPWLVAGLGNPGERYAATRHNAGAMVAERLAARLGLRLRKVRLLSLLAAEAHSGDAPLLLCVPGAFMNVCGPPLASFARKRGGSTAGHHGLDSMVEAFRSADFYRVRLGIGRPVGRWENVDFVLKPFAKRERDEVSLLIEAAADAVLSLASDGLTVTQGRYNRGGARPTIA